MGVFGGQIDQFHNRWHEIEHLNRTFHHVTCFVTGCLSKDILEGLAYPDVGDGPAIVSCSIDKINGKW